jgi:hypothetical protein
MFDTVHIAKCIRNNWINLKDSAKTFIFPSFDAISIEDVSDQNVLKAKFTELNCENCAAILIGDEFDSEYVQNINRGGLTVPSNIVIAI